MLTFVVDDCDAIYEKAQAANAVIVEPPREMPYGQRRMVLRDPAGTFVDISSPRLRQSLFEGLAPKINSRTELIVLANFRHALVFKLI